MGRVVLSFGTYGSSVGMLMFPEGWGEGGGLSVSMAIEVLITTGYRHSVVTVPT